MLLLYAGSNLEALAVEARQLIRAQCVFAIQTCKSLGPLLNHSVSLSSIEAKHRPCIVFGVVPLAQAPTLCGLVAEKTPLPRVWCFWRLARDFPTAQTTLRETFFFSVFRTTGGSHDSLHQLFPRGRAGATRIAFGLSTFLRESGSSDRLEYSLNLSFHSFFYTLFTSSDMFVSLRITQLRNISFFSNPFSLLFIAFFYF